MHRLLAAMPAALLLAACGSTPSLPDPDPESYPEPEKTEDWEDWGEDRTDTPPTAGGQRAPVIGERLSSDQIRRTLSGQTLRGCYPNGENFAERLAADGKFYDAADGGTLLGEWYVDDESLCFRYPERREAGQPDSCFAVTTKDGQLHFYTQDFTGYVASTRCPMSAEQ